MELSSWGQIKGSWPVAALVPDERGDHRVRPCQRSTALVQLRSDPEQILQQQLFANVYHMI